MKFDFSTPTPLQYFTTLVRSDEHLPLLEAAASLAQDEYPELDVQQVLSDVDHLAARLARRVAEGAGAVDRLRALNQLFFADLGFGGNVNDYYNPDNSYLHRVLHTRRGIPISLAVLWLELAQGLGLNVQGIGFPGHFLVQVTLDEGRVVLLRDPVSPQARPQLGVAATGTLTEVTTDAAGNVVDQRTGPFAGVFLVTRVGEHHLIGAVLPADTPMLVGGWDD